MQHICKTVKPIVKTNRMGSTKWTYHKERGLDSNYFIFFENFVLV